MKTCIYVLWSMEMNVDLTDEKRKQNANMLSAII